MAPPKFCGLSGRPLSFLVSTIATTGFVLFGYDQGCVLYTVALLCAKLTEQQCDVWPHFCRAFQ